MGSLAARGVSERDWTSIWQAVIVYSFPSISARWDSSCATASLAVVIDAVGALGDIEALRRINRHDRWRGCCAARKRVDAGRPNLHVTSFDKHIPPRIETACDLYRYVPISVALCVPHFRVSCRSAASDEVFAPPLLSPNGRLAVA
jgi:hypothetical protein